MQSLQMYSADHLFSVLEMNTYNKVISRLWTYLYDINKPVCSGAVIQFM